MSNRPRQKKLPRAIRCGPTGKIIFANDTTANLRGMELFNRFRTYRCHYCGGWHLTTKMPENS